MFIRADLYFILGKQIKEEKNEMPLYIAGQFTKKEKLQNKHLVWSVKD